MTQVVYFGSGRGMKLFSQFLSHLFEPRKKSYSFSKAYKKSKNHPHQSRRECERRKRQLSEGKIQNHICTTWY